MTQMPHHFFSFPLFFVVVIAKTTFRKRKTKFTITFKLCFSQFPDYPVRLWGQSLAVLKHWTIDVSSSLTCFDQHPSLFSPALMPLNAINPLSPSTAKAQHTFSKNLFPHFTWNTIRKWAVQYMVRQVLGKVSADKDSDCSPELGSFNI